MACKGRFYKYLIKFLAIPILVMPSSVLLAKMGDRNKQHIPQSSEMVKEYYIKQQRSDLKKNQSKIEVPKFKNNKNKLTSKERQCLMLKQKNANKQYFPNGSGIPSRGNDARTDCSMMTYENNNCEQVLKKREDSELEFLDNSVKVNPVSSDK